MNMSYKDDKEVLDGKRNYRKNNSELVIYETTDGNIKLIS